MKSHDSMAVSTLRLPISTGLDFDFNSIEFHIDSDELKLGNDLYANQTGENTCAKPKTLNAFDALMQSTTSTSQMYKLPDKIKDKRQGDCDSPHLTGPELMYNKLIEWANSVGAGWLIDI
jgi:hypothetical protein